MNKKFLSTLCLLSMGFVISSCTSNDNSSKVSSLSSSNEKVSSIINNTSSNETSSSSSSSSSLSSSSSSSSEDNTSKLSEEEKYVADSEKRVTVTLNVTMPEFEHNIYVIGDFNNWGKFNTLNDTSYQVFNNTISISNVEDGESYSYMFVQKINGAIYTYNFNSEMVDSANNNVIGYTYEGQLISQYCITQIDEKFSFTASEGLIVNNEVTNWTTPIYGETIDIDDPNMSYEVPTAGYNLCISTMEEPDKPYYIPLELRSDQDGAGRVQYAAYNVKLNDGDAFTIYDGNNNSGWAEENLEPYGAGTNFVTNSKLGVVCLTGGTYNIYVKLKFEDNTIYIEDSNTSSNPDDGNVGSSEAPTSGYALLVIPGDGSNNYYIPLVHIDEKDGSDREQYFGDNVPLYEGDIFKMYDGTNGVAWVEKALEPYGLYSNFEVTDDGIKVLSTGTYDIYAKFKMNDNTIYIGNA